MEPPAPLAELTPYVTMHGLPTRARACVDQHSRADIP